MKASTLKLLNDGLCELEGHVNSGGNSFSSPSSEVSFDASDIDALRAGLRNPETIDIGMWSHLFDALQSTPNTAGEVREIDSNLLLERLTEYRDGGGMLED